mmetsp:Transcript_6756/g.18859  ORF Transcript_6756/g.18859 Transcript_6756/m.18859 type:complete len:272 (-) Transcript_6756:1147-1962(-)
MAPTTASANDDGATANPVALAIGVLAPYLGGIAIALAALHLQYHVRSSLRGLMKQYRRRGVAVTGRVLECEEMPSSNRSAAGVRNGPKLIGGSGVGDAGGKEVVPSPSSKYLVEIMYQRPEHKHHANPRQQFRDPGDAAEAMQTKTFVKRYGLNDKMDRGTAIAMLCLPENARSACPKQTVDEILSYEQSGKTSLDLLVFGWVTILVLFVCSVRSVTAMDDTAAGTKVLLSGLILAEGLPWVYCTDQYLKMKRRRFDGARPMKPIKSGKGN